MGTIKKFNLLLWKNFVLQKRHPIGTAFQLILPVVLALVLVIVRQKADTIFYNGESHFPRFSFGDCRLQPIPMNSSDELMAMAKKMMIKNSRSKTQLRISYAPMNEAVDEIMVAFMRLFLQPVIIKGYESEGDLVSFFESNETTSIDVGSVVFVNVTSKSDLTGNLTYKLRFPLRKQTSFFQPPDSWLTSLTYPTFQMPGPRAAGEVTGGAPGYCDKGFLTVQHTVALAISEVLNPNIDLKTVGVSLQRFPYPPFYTDYLLLALQQFLPLILMISLLYPAFDLVKSLVYEKEKKLKESMKMMGLSGFLHWSSWFTKSLVLFGIDAIIITFLLCCSFGRAGVLIRSDGTLIFIFILLYVISGICFCMMMSTFFSKANSAATAGGIIWFATYIPYFFLSGRYSTLTLCEKILASLFCNMAMAFGAMQIFLSEGAGYGVQWSLISTPVTPDDNFTIGSSLGMMALDSLIYLIITWYIDAVFPGEYGMPQKWYFPFQKSYWCSSRQSVITESLPASNQQLHPEMFESDPEGLFSGIQIQGLTKVFNKTKIAVNNLNLNMYESQITVLLGHNGAGKTTTMSILTGLFPPSQGTAFINGYNIRHDINKARNSLGLCPQHNVVFDELTVEEHYYFACQLKDCEKSKVKSEIEQMLIATNLVDKRRNLSSELSGGMKRRLCVGMALVGGSKVVMLDEPTSGMDPTARRFAWDLLQNQSKGRTILLSTHFMDEADILGDRIAIMANGQIQCCGTPMFLKKKYGAGYHMVIVKKPGCDVPTIKTLVTSIISKAELESNVGAELSFILPHNSSNRFPHLFSQIEERKEQLKIASYGASVTTMEEVFLRVGEQSDESLKKYLNASPGSYEQLPENRDAPQSNANAESSSYVTLDRNLTTSKRSGAGLYTQQFKAMLIKKMLHTKRNWLLIIAQLVAPVCIVAVSLAIMQAEPVIPPAPPLTLNLNPFHGTIVPYSSNGTRANKFAQLFATQFQDSADVPKMVPPQTPTADLNDYLMTVSLNNTFDYTRRYVVAASFYDTDDKVEAVVHFNGQPFHSPAIALSALDTTLVRYLTGNMGLQLNVVNDPLPDPTQEQMTTLLQGYQISFQVSFNVMFGISFLVSSFVIFLVKERSCDAKHLQFVSGVHPTIFWSATLVWDFINYIIPCLIIMLVFVIFDMDGYNTAVMQGGLFLVFLLYGWCVLPFMFLFSFMFKVASSAYARVTMFNIFSGVVALIIVTLLMYINDHLREVSKTLDWVFMVLPNYCIAAAIKDLYLNFYNKRMCETHPEFSSFCQCDDVFCYNYSDNLLAWKAPGIGRELVFMTMWGIIFFLLILLIEMGLGRRLSSALFAFVWSRRNRNSLGVNPLLEGESERVDDDVVAEKKRIAATPTLELVARNNLILNDLCKYYGILKPFRAVDHVNVAVPRGECFGLLGINGAGKTTTFKMLTGDENISEGDALVEGFSIRNHIKKVQQRLGYCPQFDAVIEEMTGRETLFMFARLRGIAERDIPNMVVNLSKSLMFEEHVDKLVKNYSGGNKRKLSTAVALIGNPPLVLLDEPTTGMDPLARRMVWDTISRVRDSGCSIILTSHSMEECDVLCTRLAIMVNGKFKCLGSPQHLKSKFGNGYTLTAKIQISGMMVMGDLQDLVKRFKDFVKHSIPGSVLKDQHQAMVHYHIPSATMTWAELFSCMERAKLQFHLEDYFIGQTSLEQVFLNFTKAQIDCEDN